VAIDGATRLAYAELLPDERAETACAFLERALSWFAARGTRVERVLTDDDGQTKVAYTGPAELAERYGLSAELARRLAALDAVTDVAIEQGAGAASWTPLSMGTQERGARNPPRLWWAEGSRHCGPPSQQALNPEIRKHHRNTTPAAPSGLLDFRIPLLKRDHASGDGSRGWNPLCSTR
jgi:hypothetical protein